MLSESEVNAIRHNLKISISKKPQTSGVVTCRSISIREHVLRFLLGDKQHVIILIPGDSVEEVSISELMRGGAKDE